MLTHMRWNKLERWKVRVTLSSALQQQQRMRYVVPEVLAAYFLHTYSMNRESHPTQMHTMVQMHNIPPPIFRISDTLRECCMILYAFLSSFRRSSPYACYLSLRNRRLDIHPRIPLLHLQNLSGVPPSPWLFLPLKIIVVSWLAKTARILISADVLYTFLTLHEFVFLSLHIV
jgi:hypothetical protein